MRGFISTFDYEKAISEINSEILDLVNGKSFDLMLLNQIVQNNRSCNKNYAVYVSGLMNEIDDYNYEKSKNGGYDPTGKRLNVLKQKYDEVIDGNKDYKAMVKDLLKNDVPELIDIFLAYRLCEQNGFDDMLFGIIEGQMENRENDEEIRFVLTERIFQFINA
jgi:hypothetical protein